MEFLVGFSLQNPHSELAVPSLLTIIIFLFVRFCLEGAFEVNLNKYILIQQQDATEPKTNFNIGDGILLGQQLDRKLLYVTQ